MEQWNKTSFGGDLPNRLFTIPVSGQLVSDGPCLKSFFNQANIPIVVFNKDYPRIGFSFVLRTAGLSAIETSVTADPQSETRWLAR
jgi:hypothetical protein